MTFLQLASAAQDQQTLLENLLSQFSWVQTLEFFGRLLLACICGAAIGYERSRRFKGAGIRTHIIVCCGAALIMLVSKYGFGDLTGTNGDIFGAHGTDPARLAAQVVSGISFLGAGVIFKNNGAVRGLTTAAGLWVTAGIGLAVGTGMIWVGVFCTVLIWVLQMLMHRFKIGADSYNAYQIQFTINETPEFHRMFNSQMEKWEATATESKIEHCEDGTVTYDITLRTTQSLDMNSLTDFFDENVKARSMSLNNLH